MLKEGICQHFATAATLMYRALGIPARYVTGYLAKTEANTWADITTKQGHAWVEVYVDGIGWIPIEVTASDNGPIGGGDNGGGDNGGGDNGGEDDQLSISVTPVAVVQRYAPGVTIYPSSIRITNFDSYLARGYTYDFELSGSHSGVGASRSYIDNFIIYDPDGNDVTSLFNIKINEGKLQLYLYELNVFTPYGSKEYDGKALEIHDYSTSGEFNDSHTITEVKYMSSITSVGNVLNVVALKNSR